MAAVCDYPTTKRERCQHCGNVIEKGERALKTVRTFSEKWFCCEACARAAGYKITWF